MTKGVVKDFVFNAIRNAVRDYNLRLITGNEYDEIISECNDMLHLAGVR